MDAVPGRLNETWFKANKEGIYYCQCSELCGPKHAFMPINVKVVSEDEIAKGIHIGLEKNHQLIEGAAGATIASFINQKEKFKGQTVVLVMCGGNISSSVLKSIL